MRRVLVSVLVLALAGSILAGCSSKKSEKRGALDPFAGVGSPYYKGKGKIPLGGGRYHVGQPYQVAGRWFTPKEQPRYDKKGPASWYGEAFHRRMTSNGEYFDMAQLTAAHPTLPLPSYAKVTNLQNGAEVIVRINDRGPFVGPRIIDLSKRTAEVLDFKRQGKTNVRVQYIGPAPINDRNATHLMAMNQELQNGTPLRRMIAAVDNSTSGGLTNVAIAKRKRASEPVIASVEEPPVPGSYYVQVAAYSDPASAEQIQSELQAIGPVQVTELISSDGALFRVRLGPIADRDEAETALVQVISSGHPDAHLIMSHPIQAGLAPN